MGRIHVSDMDDLYELKAKSVGAVSKNVFNKRTDGGARGGPCEKSVLEVVIWHPRSVCAIYIVHSYLLF